MSAAVQLHLTAQYLPKAVSCATSDRTKGQTLPNTLYMHINFVSRHLMPMSGHISF